jgi:hypothetical protein
MPVTEITIGAADHPVDLAAGGLEPRIPLSA